MPAILFRRLIFALATLALLSGAAGQASTVFSHGPQQGCAAMAAHARQDKSDPCKQCDFGCPMIADCAGCSIILADFALVSQSALTSGALYWEPAGGRAGLSVRPQLFPPIAL